MPVRALLPTLPKSQRAAEGAATTGGSSSVTAPDNKSRCKAIVDELLKRHHVYLSQIQRAQLERVVEVLVGRFNQDKGDDDDDSVEDNGIQSSTAQKEVRGPQTNNKTPVATLLLQDTADNASAISDSSSDISRIRTSLSQSAASHDFRGASSIGAPDVYFENGGSDDVEESSDDDDEVSAPGSQSAFAARKLSGTILNKADLQCTVGKAEETKVGVRNEEVDEDDLEFSGDIEDLLSDDTNSELVTAARIETKTTAAQVTPKANPLPLAPPAFLSTSFNTAPVSKLPPLSASAHKAPGEVDTPKTFEIKASVPIAAAQPQRAQPKEVEAVIEKNTIDFEEDIEENIFEEEDVQSMGSGVENEKPGKLQSKEDDYSDDFGAGETDSEPVSGDGGFGGDDDDNGDQSDVSFGSEDGLSFGDNDD